MLVGLVILQLLEYYKILGVLPQELDERIIQI